jgi:hypothetical protein
MADTTANLGLPYIIQGQAQKEITHNTSLDILDTSIHTAEEAITLIQSQIASILASKPKFTGVIANNVSGTSQTIPISTPTKIVLATHTDFNGTFWDNTNSRILIPAGVAVVELTFGIGWVVGVDSTYQNVRVYVYRNGSSYFEGAKNETSADSSVVQSGFSTGPITVSAGDYFDLYASVTGHEKACSTTRQTFLSMTVLE